MFIDKVSLVPRVNVRPEDGFIMWSYNNPSNGFYYREDPAHWPYMVEVGKPKSYGKLMVAAQYVIYKRGGFGDWSQFAELFGQPFRVGKYPSYDDTQRQKLASALQTMGGAGWAVLPERTLLFLSPSSQ